MTQRQRTLIALLGLILAAALPAFCSPASADDLWRLRAGGVWLDPDGESERTVNGDRVRTATDQDFGLGLTFERRLSERLGVELGVPVISNPDLRVRIDQSDGPVGASDNLAMAALTVGINLHLTPGRPADVYLGPYAGWVLFDDLDFTVDDETFRFAVNDGVTYGVVLGIDVPVSERWSVCASARYMALEIEPIGDDGGGDPIDYDTVALAAGFGFSF